MSNSALDQLKKFYALPPYDTFSNHCAHDGLFASSIVKEFGLVEVNRALRELDEQPWTDKGDARSETNLTIEEKIAKGVVCDRFNCGQRAVTKRKRDYLCREHYREVRKRSERDKSLPKCAHCNNTARLGEVYCSPCEEKVIEKERKQLMYKHLHLETAAASDLNELRIVVQKLIHLIETRMP